ncbi:acylphosphatase [Stella humosa]|uniref:acylphosphatase n=1 Tax=Stella humosa TaxID=94 RepID=A0A3N1MA10_9PROT|nr:acylphosphatase [Stella humosa]ROQ00511.1 acylphosphatase [Stella humosa]BBK30245.1 acylphosphatase [Stella humosa]
MADAIAAARLVISGRVQAVWYRAWTVETATRLGLRGWVRNREDGSVEAMLIGPPGMVDQMAQHCLTGPPKARVTGIDRTPAEDDGSQGFAQRPTV